MERLIIEATPPAHGEIDQVKCPAQSKGSKD